MSRGRTPDSRRRLRILINGETHELPPRATVAQAVATLPGARDGRGVAAAVDGQVVPRADLDQRDRGLGGSGQAADRAAEDGASLDLVHHQPVHAGRDDGAGFRRGRRQVEDGAAGLGHGRRDRGHRDRHR